jgi:ribosome-associated translation inhibitor RaiA
MSLMIQGVAAADPFRTFIDRKLGAVLGRAHARATASVVTFTDVNGPRGGVDTRCAVTVETPGRPAHHASALGADMRLALDAALAALQHELLRDRDRRRTLARRPKKYFVAEQGNQPEGEAALPPVRHRRRSA